MIDYGLIFGGISLAIALIGLGYEHYRTIGKVREELNEKTSRIESRIARLETMIEPFWQLVRNNLSKLLKLNPTQSLLHKLMDNTISKSELDTLEAELRRELEEKKDDLQYPVGIILALWMIEVKKREKDI